MSEEFFLPTILDGEDKGCFLKNRIRKNYKHIRKWAKKAMTNCFRIYDHEVPGFPFAIDYYDQNFYIQHFVKEEEREQNSELKEKVIAALKDLFNASSSEIFWRNRNKREKLEQYEKLSSQKEFKVVQEYGVMFYINLTDYLDTGLFLDHRETRQIVAKECKGKTLLNLFAYTCSFSVHAAKHGAVFTKSVDLSNTYTAWGEENFLLNNLSLKKNVVVRADCLKFLDQELLTSQKYDVIVIDPPTISRSKKMDQFFDVQRDYIFLLKKGLSLLNEGGKIFFSTNLRSFSFDLDQFSDCKVIDISKKTLPIDFHNQKIHKCFVIQKL
jgi:23S rRNA G2069 N7-methylase RlmK/C1962 C5-methylase RlmI